MQLGISERTVYRARAARDAANAKKLTPAGKRAYASAPLAPVEVPPIPPGLTGREADLWIVEERINATRTQLHHLTARIAGGASAHGLPALEGILSRLLEQRAELRPPAAEDPGAEEKRWREDAARVRAKIEAGVRAFEEG